MSDQQSNPTGAARKGPAKRKAKQSPQHGIDERQQLTSRDEKNLRYLRIYCALRQPDEKIDWYYVISLLTKEEQKVLGKIVDDVFPMIDNGHSIEEVQQYIAENYPNGLSSQVDQQAETPKARNIFMPGQYEPHDLAQAWGIFGALNAEHLLEFDFTQEDWQHRVQAAVETIAQTLHEHQA